MNQNLDKDEFFCSGESESLLKMFVSLVVVDSNKSLSHTQFLLLLKHPKTCPEGFF